MNKKLLRDVVATMLENAKENPQPFKPCPFYSHIGDFISMYFDDAESYSETVNEHLTLYKSIDGQKITGCKIHNVKSDILSDQH